MLLVFSLFYSQSLSFFLSLSHKHLQFDSGRHARASNAFLHIPPIANLHIERQRSRSGRREKGRESGRGSRRERRGRIRRPRRDHITVCSVEKERRERES
jgi:hypothetical protein